ncbi:uncharacterized protein LOC113228118 [Hyposmocoma kahamanoa]|uniref:uncharacterized protein LOC113228118 n=1 Tax=Hyposmocoma kahamanoa TaxID=1477025 RepID=UPI000E6D6233|nr:uncharacterized protein LOC113228118 [Hyposmocoma kahamanoa]
MSPMSAMNEQYECAHSTGPYIPISECITGVRAQDTQRAFTFDPKNIVMSTRTPFDRSDNRNYQMYMSQPHIKLNNTEFSENESNLSDEECKSLNASQSNIRDWSVAKTFTKLAISPNRNGISSEGPPVPPRPPKTLIMSRDLIQKDPFHGPKFQEPIESQDTISPQQILRLPKRHGAPPSPGRVPLTPNTMRQSDDEEERSPGYQSMQYCNLPPSLPPAVDRALKPRHSSHIIHFNHFGGHTLQLYQADDSKADGLQYLDLDLHPTKPVPSKPQEIHHKKLNIAHGKSLSAVNTYSAYKTVDFVKTKAFNITRQDAEASRSNQQ